MKSKIKVSEKSLNNNTDRRKKTDKADLENKKGIFFEIGLILSLCLVLFAFEWKSYSNLKSFANEAISKEEIEEMIPITKITKPEPKTVKPIISILKIVANTEKNVKDIPVDVEVKTKDPNEPYIPIVAKKEEEVVDNEIFKVVQFEPEYIGGEEERIMFLRKNVVYPQLARETGIQGTVFLTFIIEKDGGISNVQILRGIGGGCDEEATRVVNAMPKWKPGKQRDKAVRVQFTLPIKFILAN
ncbi:MAG: TonB family protein [Bacteroidales bacterium]